MVSGGRVIWCCVQHRRGPKCQNILSQTTHQPSSLNLASTRPGAAKSSQSRAHPQRTTILRIAAFTGRQKHGLMRAGTALDVSTLHARHQTISSAVHSWVQSVMSAAQVRPSPAHAGPRQYEGRYFASKRLQQSKHPRFMATYGTDLDLTHFVMQEIRFRPSIPTTGNDT